MKDAAPFLSIIIPTYNTGDTLEAALNSIFDQTFTNFEIWLIDGKSSDNTLEVARKFKEKYGKISIVSQSDQGIYDAMNKGVSLAGGNWVYFMGGDDSFYKIDVLQNFFDFTLNRETHVIYGNVYAPGFGGVYDGPFTYAKLSQKNICHQSIFFRRKVFELIGNYSLRYKILADWDHNIKWFFSPVITKEYFEETIAYYSEGGYSSKIVDNQFIEDKNLKILKLGMKKLTFGQWMKIYKETLENKSSKIHPLFPLHFLMVQCFLLKLGMKIHKIGRRIFILYFRFIKLYMKE